MNWHLKWVIQIFLDFHLFGFLLLLLHLIEFILFFFHLLVFSAEQHGPIWFVSCYSSSKHFQEFFTNIMTSFVIWSFCYYLIFMWLVFLVMIWPNIKSSLLQPIPRARAGGQGWGIWALTKSLLWIWFATTRRTWVY